MKQEFLEELRKIDGIGPLYEQELMSRHTTFRVGGPADVLVAPESRAISEIIRLCARYGETYYIIGNGSNLLVGDLGVRGLVVEMTPNKDELRIEDDRLVAGAGVLLPQAASMAADYGLTGMEFAAGIPGSIGGAVVMNAGAYGGEMKDIIEWVTVVTQTGEEKRLSVEGLDFGYRRSCIPAQGYIVTKVCLKLSHGDKEVIQGKMKELNDKRREKQPLEYPSAGSTFKRPEGYFAGKLIMDAGLRGFSVGGAQVSEKHCGFVINKGGASAKDICELIKRVSAEVERQFAVVLEPEVKMLGEFE